MILPIRPVLDVPSKNICHTLSSEVILASMTSSECSCVVSTFSGLDELLESLQELVLDRLLGDKSHVVLDSRMTQLASLEFKDPGFIMRMRKSWLLKQHVWFGQPNNIVSSRQRRQEQDTPWRNYIEIRLWSEFCSSSRWPVHNLYCSSMLEECPKSGP